MEAWKTGLCQMPVTDNKMDNLATAAKYLESCAAKGAHLAVLPEMFCCPYRNEDFPLYAEPEGDRIWTFLAEMAQKLQLYLVGGSMPERDGDGRLYNTCYIFGPDGRPLGRHRKMHLFDIAVEGGQHFQESAVFTAGDDVTVVEMPWGKVGVMICFDMRFPELARLLVQKGAESIVIPAAFNMTTGPAHWELHLRGRAVDNQAYVFACSPARNPDASYVAYGNSMGVDPWGSVLDRLDGKPGILTLTASRERVKEVRRQLPLLESIRADLYQVTFRPS